MLESCQLWVYNRQRIWLDYLVEKPFNSLFEKLIKKLLALVNMAEIKKKKLQELTLEEFKEN